MKKCYKCKSKWNGINQPKTRETCSKCGADLHCCFNCSLYDEKRPYECMEPNTDPVRDKERYNYCEEFEFKSGNPEKPAEDSSQKAREAFKKLFK